MNPKTLKETILTHFGDNLGVYRPLNIPSISIGIPDTTLVCEGVEVCISELPDTISTKNNIHCETWLVYINDYGSPSDFRHIVSNVNRYFNHAEVKFISRLKSMTMKDYPLINSATVILDFYELTNKKPYLGLE